MLHVIHLTRGLNSNWIEIWLSVKSNKWRDLWFEWFGFMKVCRTWQLVQNLLVALQRIWAPHCIVVAFAGYLFAMNFFLIHNYDTGAWSWWCNLSGEWEAKFLLWYIFYSKHWCTIQVQNKQILKEYCMNFVNCKTWSTLHFPLVIRNCIFIYLEHYFNVLNHRPVRL